MTSWWFFRGFFTIINCTKKKQRRLIFLRHFTTTIRNYQMVVSSVKILQFVQAIILINKLVGVIQPLPTSLWCKINFRWNETERTIVRHSSRTLSLFCFTHHHHGTSYVTEVTRIFKKEYARQIFFLENYDRLPWLLFTFLYTEARVDFPPLKLRFAENL